ncbi:MAG TPA: anti-sigma factor [Kofleriaceae bacterium]|nr:anti-sigma factor [Kofleriaceae bacterium]
MKCDSVREKLTAYLDGELEGERGSAVRGHLRGCDACRQVAADEAALRDGLRALPPLDPPASLWAGVQQRLAAAEVADAERPAWRRALAWLAPRAPQLGLAGAALTAAIILIVVKLNRSEETHVAQVPTAPQQPMIGADPPKKNAPVEAKDEGDMTASLAAEPAQVTASYAQTARELLDIAADARAEWPDDRKHDFDAQVAAMQKKIAVATTERPRRDAYRKLIRYLQRAVIEDDVALANIGGAQ